MRKEKCIWGKKMCMSFQIHASLFSCRYLKRETSMRKRNIYEKTETSMRKEKCACLFEYVRLCWNVHVFSKEMYMRKKKHLGEKRNIYEKKEKYMSFQIHTSLLKCACLFKRNVYEKKEKSMRKKKSTCLFNYIRLCWDVHVFSKEMYISRFWHTSLLRCMSILRHAYFWCFSFLIDVSLFS